MLVIESKTYAYRFFRVFDRGREPDLLLPNHTWIVANYGNNTTAFHLESNQEHGLDLPDGN